MSIHVAQGDNVRAISELNRYLKEFMNDGEAWMELCDLYILEQVGSNSHGLILVEPVPVIKSPLSVMKNYKESIHGAYLNPNRTTQRHPSAVRNSSFKTLTITSTTKSKNIFLDSFLVL